MRTFVLGLMASVALIVTTPAFAQSTDVVADPMTKAVSYTTAALRTDAGANHLRHLAERAIVEVCGGADSNLTDSSGLKCRTRTAAVTRSAVADAIVAARSGTSASIASITVSAK